MNIRKLLVLGILALSLPAAAQFTTITAAYEVAVSDLRLPGVEGGTLTFRECSGCEAQTVRVTANTRYVLNNTDFALADFRAELKRVAGARDKTATVMHHLESNTITAIMVRL